MATTDGLTGLYNRRYFYELAEAEIGRSLRYSHSLSVMMFDIDFFKRINDTFGHTIGDVALTTVGKVTKESLRKNDILARYGGEEFIVLLPETTESDAFDIAERTRKQIEDTPIRTPGSQVTLTASFGVSDFLGKTNSKSEAMILSEIISSADKALYASKNTGRNKVTVFKDEERHCS